MVIWLWCLKVVREELMELECNWRMKQGSNTYWRGRYEEIGNRSDEKINSWKYTLCSLIEYSVVQRNAKFWKGFSGSDNSLFQSKMGPELVQKKIFVF